MKKTLFVLGIIAMVATGFTIGSRSANAQVPVGCYIDAGGVFTCPDDGSGGTGGGGQGSAWDSVCRDPWCWQDCIQSWNMACFAPCPAHPYTIPGDCWQQAVQCAIAESCVTGGWPILAVSGYFVDCSNWSTSLSGGLSPNQYYNQVCLGSGAFSRAPWGVGGVM